MEPQQDFKSSHQQTDSQPQALHGSEACATIEHERSYIQKARYLCFIALRMLVCAVPTAIRCFYESLKVTMDFDPLATALSHGQNRELGNGRSFYTGLLCVISCIFL